jgi:tricorn protease
MTSRILRSGPAALAVVATLVFLASPALAALEECRLLRHPDIQGDRIVFVYGGDLWTVARSGGVAQRLTTHEGIERFPKFSPDGKTIAFTAEYDGNADAYSVPLEGGEPRRLTWHPYTDQIAEWYPDGKSILIRSLRASSMPRFDRFFRVPAEGGFEEMLPLPQGGFASLSSDGSRLAYVTPSYDNRTWKRYKGGNAPEIWLYEMKKNLSEKITDWEGSDEWPMWHDSTVYYASDKGGRRVNVWAYDTLKKTHRQVTQFTDYDVKWPAIGGSSIVFEKGGYLFVMDLPAEKATKIQVLVPDDRPAARAEVRNVAPWTDDFDLSPSAKRAAFEARGDIFTVPAEKGDPRNLTHSPGSRERDPVWSPDGKWIAYLSDASGEMEVHVIGSDGATPDRQVTKGGATFRFSPRWSPDSKKIAFSDKTMTLWWCDVADGKLTKVDKSSDGEIHDYQWSGDSGWLTYTLPGENGFGRIMIYSLDSGKTTPVTDGMSDDSDPAFDPEGKYLYFISRRTLNPEFGGFELNFQFSATNRIYAATLRKDVASPVAPESDEEKGDEKDAKDKDADGSKSKDEASKKDGDKKDSSKKDSDRKDGEEDKKDKEPPKPLQIDLDGIGQRIAVLHIPAGRYGGLTAYKGKLLFLGFQPAFVFSDDDEGPPPPNATIHVYNIEKREDKVVLKDVRGSYAASKDGGKILYRFKDGFGIVETAEGKKAGDGKIAAETLMAVVDPRQEWMQMFNEAWRLERDFYYDPGMGGLDWKAVGEQYRQLVPFVAHRADLNYILGELIGELSTSHTYVGGGDYPNVNRVDVGLLGADYDLDAKSGRYRFKKIYRERDWNSRTGAPLGEPGVDVREGDYLLAVNGIEIKAPRNVYSVFEATAGKQTQIKVGSSPDDPNARTFTVKPVGNEFPLRYIAWVTDNREKVWKATGGRVAYIHVPNTSIDGIREFSRQYYPQVDKDGIIVDERFNGGGFIPDFFIERLQRTTWVRWSNRDGNGFKTPGTALDGPKCILINQYAGSGGDAFPFYFKMKGLGPLIGKRTWGGLVGISHSLPLVDGGQVTMPDFGMYDHRAGEWLVENHGVDPDIDVENTPHEMVAGRDPQLERAIQYVTEQMKANPPKKPLPPKYKVQK